MSITKISIKSNKKSINKRAMKSNKMTVYKIPIKPGKTSLNNISLVLTWTVNNFSQIHHDQHSSLTSPTFKLGETFEEKYTLELYPDGDEMDPNKMTCYLHRSAGRGRLIVDCTFHLIDSTGKKLIFETTSKTMKENDYVRCSMILVEELKKEIDKWPEDILIVRCAVFLRKRNKITPSNVLHIKATSTVSIDRKFFVWSVEKPDNLDWRQRKVFYCTEVYSFEIFLTTSCKNDILIHIKNVSDNDCSFFYVTTKINLMSAADVVQESATDKFVFKKSNKNILWKFPNFFTKKTLRDKKCIDKGFFTLSIEFIIPNGNVIHEMENTAATPVDEAQPAALKSLKQLLSDNSDVVLKAEGVSFHAHKCLLSSRSPVFRGMFEKDSTQNQTGVFEINTMDSSTLKRLLKYLYSETIDEIDYESTVRLIIAADMYQVRTLAEECARILMSFLSMENALDIYSIADMIEHNDLKASVINLLDKHAEYILSSPKWLAWSNQNVKLGLEISSNVALHLAKKCKLD